MRRGEDGSAPNPRVIKKACQPKDVSSVDPKPPSALYTQTSIKTVKMIHAVRGRPARAKPIQRFDIFRLTKRDLTPNVS